MSIMHHKLMKCVFWQILLSVKMTHVLLHLPLTDGRISNILLTTGAVNAKTNSAPSDQIGYQLKATTLVQSCSMVLELHIGRKLDNILTIITALLIEPYPLDSTKLKREILNNGILILKLTILEHLIHQNFNQNVKIFVEEDVHIIEKIPNCYLKIDLYGEIKYFKIV